MSTRRMFVPGLSHHVRHRGNDRRTVFHDDRDRVVFLSLLGRACAEFGADLHGYALMDNHHHLQVTGRTELSLPRMMQKLGSRYVRYFNRRHGRTGTLWEGRYRASLILDERYWLTCLRYIELNPVRAGIVRAPESYLWSSSRHHGLGEPNALVTTHALYKALGDSPAQRRSTWTSLCAEGIRPEDAALVWEAIHHDRPLCEAGPEPIIEVEKASPWLVQRLVGE